MLFTNTIVVASFGSAPLSRENQKLDDLLGYLKANWNSIYGSRSLKSKVDADTVKSYAEDLKNLLEEAEIAESRAFLRSFIKRIVINGGNATIYYNLPMPPYGKRKQSIGVLPIDTPGGAKMIFPH